MSITGLITLTGKSLSGRLEYEEEHETIPASLTDTIESGTCDEEEYEGYQGNVRHHLLF